jgi:hypothetical protein
MMIMRTPVSSQKATGFEERVCCSSIAIAGAKVAGDSGRK